MNLGKKLFLAATIYIVPGEDLLIIDCADWQADLNHLNHRRVHKHCGKCYSSTNSMLHFSAITNAQRLKYFWIMLFMYIF